MFWHEVNRQKMEMILMMRQEKYPVTMNDSEGQILKL